MENRQAKKNHGKGVENSSQIKKRALKYYQGLNMELIGGVSAVFFLVVSCLLTFSQLETSPKHPAAIRLSDREATLSSGKSSHITYKSANMRGDKATALVQRHDTSAASVLVESRSMTAAVNSELAAAGGGKKMRYGRTAVLASARRASLRGVAVKKLKNSEVVAEYRQPFFKQHYRTNSAPKPDIDKTGQNLAKAATGQDGVDESYASDKQSLDAGGGPVSSEVLRQREKFLVMRVARLTRDIQSGYADRWWNSVVTRDPQRAKYATEAPRVLLEKYQRELTALRAEAG
ncbi:hypothetical protein ACOHYD_12230 [Desulfobacterota bacterium M19]